MGNLFVQSKQTFHVNVGVMLRSRERERGREREREGGRERVCKHAAAVAL